MGKNELKKPGADHQRTLPFRPIPEYKPFVMPESARPMSFCEFQRLKFEDQLLGEILELSRIGRVVNPPEDVPFDTIAKDALDQEAETLKSRGVEFSVANDLPTVRVDRMRIAEVLVNLIENSVKYMGDQAHPKIEISHQKDEGETIFFVRDNGVGIDPSQHEKVFDLFYRLDPKSEGTGVGLTIVKRIIELHGGRIWIESEIGKGCAVCFTLHLANVE